MNHYDWVDQFIKLYEKARRQYRDGQRPVADWFEGSESAFLASIGCLPSELYDFAEDAPDLSFETALLITAVRRDYFLTIQKGRWSERRLTFEDFPAKKDAIDGIEWLPRIILKAKSKLRGEMPADMMYGCSGDRAFLKKHDIHPADFLRFVWSARDDDAKIAGYVKGG